MKRFALAILIIASSSTPSFAKYSGGSGSSWDPYKIANATDLMYLGAHANDYNQCFIMTANIDLDPNLPGNREFTAAVIAPDTNNSTTGFQGKSFTGCFNGNGYVIENLKIYSDLDCLGLFGDINGTSAQVKNLGIVNAAIYGYSSYYVGGLCGSNSGTISNCYVIGQISGGIYLNFAGGLCAKNEYGTINDCYASVAIFSQDISYYLGGLCGENLNGTISNCYSTGFLYGTDYLGGLCGWNNAGLISNCYSIGKVNRLSNFSYHIGGLCGGSESGTINNCYFYLFNGPENNFGTDLETEQMTEQSSFKGFDFVGNPDDGIEEHWAITTGYCPRLSWQTNDGFLPPTYVPDTNLSGSGHADDPFQINNAADFSEFRTNISLTCGYYALTYDINLSWQSFNTAAIQKVFGGHLDGGGHKITKYTCNTTGPYAAGYLGIFAVLNGSVYNLGIENISITAQGGDYIGGLCAINANGIISNCYVTGQIIISQYDSDYIGGLCGYNYFGTIFNSYANCPITSNGYGSGLIGGLCGENESGDIRDCCATGNVTGDTDSDGLGGLCGQNYKGAIIGSYAGGSVLGHHEIGGLCGYNRNGEIKNCRAHGYVSGGQDVGGLCGRNYFNSTISNSCATGSVSGYNFIGGLCGYNWYGTISSSSSCSTGQITGANGVYYLGGLCGKNESGSINNSYSTSRVTGGTGSYYVGGLCGDNFYSSVNGSYSTGQVIGGTNSNYLGGLCGENQGTVGNCYSKSAVSGDYFVGGLCGDNVYFPGTLSKISNCYSTGSVAGNHYKGGFCGVNDGSIISCFWDINTSGITTSSGGTGLTTVQMKQQASFVGWDFVWETANGPNDVWAICEGVSYPKFAWQFIPGDFDNNKYVDFSDFAILAAKWMQTDSTLYCGGTDLTGDGLVDIRDLAVFVHHWLIE
ncbi:MAG: GLUG motif-containing protein [Sedimentisphaerales bacterium]